MRDFGQKQILGVVWLICLTTFQTIVGYLMQKFDSFVNVYYHN